MKGLKKELILKYEILILFIIVILSVSTVYMASNQLKSSVVNNRLSSNVNIFEGLVKMQYGGFSYEGDDLFGKDGTLIRENYDLVDEMAELTEGVYTIFVAKGDDFERISTNIKKEDGKRAIGTTLGKDGEVYKSIMKQKDYLGEASILGKKYLVAYKPIIADNKVIGILFSGVSEAKIKDSINENIKKLIEVIIICAIIASIIGAIITYFITNGIIKPLNIIKTVMDKVAHYNLDTKGERKAAERYFDKKNEIGEIMRSMGLMVSNLKEIIKNINYNAEHTSNTSKELADIVKYTNTASLELSSAVGNIAEGATSQAHDTTDAAGDIEEN